MTPGVGVGLGVGYGGRLGGVGGGGGAPDLSTLNVLQQASRINANTKIIGASTRPTQNTIGPITVTRPANTTLYAINDVWGPAGDARIQVPNVNQIAGGLATLNARFRYDLKAGAAAPQFTVFLFDGQPATVLGDNDPFAGLADADVDKILGSWSFSFGGLQAEGALILDTNGYTTFGSVSPATYPITARDLWLYFVINSYNPIASQVAQIWLRSEPTPT